jgi:hypothetical protein
MSAYGELERGAEPFNDSISRWLAAHRALPLNSRNPIVFASVSALTYVARWKFSNTVRAKLRPFRGLHQTRTVPFATNIRFATLQEFPECRRVAIALADGGTVFLANAVRPDRLEACFEEPPTPYSYASSAVVSLPEIRLESATSLSGILQEHGIRKIFQASSDPFPGLRRGQPLSDVEQSVHFRIDRHGIGVEATTASDYALSGGGPAPHHIVFDSPFEVRVQDSNGNDVADVTIDDVYRCDTDVEELPGRPGAYPGRHSFYGARGAEGRDRSESTQYAPGREKRTEYGRRGYAMPHGRGTYAVSHRVLDRGTCRADRRVRRRRVGGRFTRATFRYTRRNRP